ncbi:MAG: SgcJ/EcaC family oxidoreductase [Acidobacteriota bacterium]|nr:SgcJ/EcaC family oxidoreductase [Acidobacteriota bacterium]
MVCVLSGAAALSGQQSPADEAILRQRIAAHQLASEHGDIRGLVDIYAPDAQTVALNGKVLRGREEIEADYRTSLLSASSRSGRHHTHPPDSIRIEFVTPDVALIEVASVNVGGADAAGAPLADSRAQLVTVWRKRTGEWLVVYQRVVPRPAP